MAQRIYGLKKFFSHLSWLMVLNLLIKPTYLLLVDAKIQDVLGPEVWGRYFPLVSLGILLNIVLDMGLSSHMTRLLSKEPDEIKGAFIKGWKSKIGLIPLYLIVLMTIGWALGYSSNSLKWLFWIGCNQALLSGILYARSGLQALGAHVADAWISITDRFLLLVGMGVLLLNFDSFQVEWLLVGTSGALGIALLTGLWRLKKHTRLDLASNADETEHSTQSILRASWPYALLFLLMMTYHRVDAIMLERWAPNGEIQAGWYAMGYRLFEAANMIGFLFATLLLPYFTRMLKAKEDVRPLAITVSRLLWVGGSSVAWVSFMFPEAFLSVFYSEHTLAAAPAFSWLMLSFAIFAQGYVFSTLLTARGDIQLLNRLAFSGAAANVILNGLWLSQATAFNAGWGCALISAGTQLLVVGLQMGFVFRFHPGKSWWSIGKTGGLHFILAGAICWLFSRWADANQITALASLASCLLLGLVPGVINQRGLRALLTDKMNTFADS